ncbi:MAG: sugar phosphate nucleotidyltransferase, partial [Myxococcota bacterium]
MYAVIMAGGSGTRFWPLSRRHQPKQLLPFFGERPMIADAVARIAPLVPASHILIVTSDHLVQPVRETLPELPPDNIIAEPVGRNTAPCIGLATHLIQARGGHEDP